MTENASILTIEPTEVLRRYRLPSDLAQEPDLQAFASAKLRWSPEADIGYAFPLPDQETLNAFYSRTYRRLMNKKRDIGHYMSSPNYRAQSRSQVRWVQQVANDEGSWLDVGAGLGLLLRTVQASMPQWSLHAVEPDEDGAGELRKFVELRNDFAALWAGSAYPQSYFDVISLSHVLEHLVDPISSLKTLHRYLKPGGYLLLEVPNDPYRHLLSVHRTSDLPHLWFFSSKGLVQFVKAAGFDIERAAVLGIRRPGEATPFLTRARQMILRRIRGPLAMLDDSDWYAEDDNRCDLRILARKTELDQL
ncbi:class I SAM-dependent methyltransferase [Parvibaculum sp.]|uniref:class I SAM-dependent methyltransferase n=1 Tax=Parvibaculum sp. TaxID=2024848 RepID=UPI00391BDBD8